MTDAYEDREQTRVKHELLGRYLRAAVPIVGHWAEDICFVDCLAGPWESKTSDLSDTSFSVAINSLRGSKQVLHSRGKQPTFRCLFVENEPSAFSQLSAFSANITDLQVVAKPWDFSQSVRKIRRAIERRPRSFAFIFIDPKGWNFASIDLIKPLLNIPNTEVIINLMTSWIRRFLSDSTKNLQEFIGPSAPKIMNLSGDEKEDEIVRSYAAAIRANSIHDYVCTMPVLKSKSHDFHFHLVYATSHLKGVEEFKRAEKAITPFMHLKRAEAKEREVFGKTGQFNLYSPIQELTDPRYDRYRHCNLQAARLAILDLARTQSNPISYDHVWATWMQFACVHEQDLRSELTRLQQSGLLQASMPADKLRRGGNNLVSLRSQGD